MVLVSGFIARRCGSGMETSVPPDSVSMPLRPLMAVKNASMVTAASKSASKKGPYTTVVKKGGGKERKRRLLSTYETIDSKPSTMTIEQN